MPDSLGTRRVGAGIPSTIDGAVSTGRRTVVMKDRISRKAATYKRRVSPVREIMNFADPRHIQSLGLDPRRIISFAGGWVNHAAPSGLRAAYAEIIADESLFHRSGAYSPTLGSPEGRDAIVAFEKTVFGVTDLAPSQVAVGTSSSQMTQALFHTLLDPGDKVLLLDPSYCNYPMQIFTTLDVEIIRFPVLDVDEWRYVADERVDALKSFIEENEPKLILLVSPDNPTSQVLTTEFVRSAVQAAERVGAFVLMDFAYKSIVFEGDCPEYFSWGPKDNFLSVHSNSKWSKNLGRRMGWVEAPEFIVEALESILNSTILCPDNLHQMAIARFMESAGANGQLTGYVEETNRRYRAAAERTVAAVEEHLGFRSLRPQGGLYTCVPVGEDGAHFVDRVLRNTGVLFVPGWGFGSTLQKAVRISYGPLVNDLDLIDEGMKRVGEFLRP
jgi:aspartate/methionine/tyrosine aminotransferase